jgi:hypothetical protein
MNIQHSILHKYFSLFQVLLKDPFKHLKNYLINFKGLTLFIMYLQIHRENHHKIISLFPILPIILFKLIHILLILIKLNIIPLKYMHILYDFLQKFIFLFLKTFIKLI